MTALTRRAASAANPEEAGRARPARRSDAEILVRLVHSASHGLAFAVWRDLAAEGEDPWAVGRQRVLRESGGSSWRNARIWERGGAPAGGLIGYPIDAEDPLTPEIPMLFRPLIALENQALGTFYINVLAVLEGFQRRGVARALIEDAAETRAAGRDLSLIVADGNRGARRCYEALGFTPEARAPVAFGLGWSSADRDWILMRREAAR